MKITNLKDNQKYNEKVASLLFEEFQDNWPNGWPTLASALVEVENSICENRISKIAMDENNVVLGWIGGIEEREGKVWEIHPLVVSNIYQEQGVGKALVRDFEMEVKKRGALTIWVGSDDESNMTTVSGKELYPNLLENLLEIKNRKDHPFEFYQKLGFSISGILPDANGIGKPDIFLAKKVK